MISGSWIVSQAPHPPSTAYTPASDSGGCEQRLRGQSKKQSGVQCERSISSVFNGSHFSVLKYKRNYYWWTGTWLHYTYKYLKEKNRGKSKGSDFVAVEWERSLPGVQMRDFWGNLECIRKDTLMNGQGWSPSWVCTKQCIRMWWDL